jgi:hypothetical protein
MQTSKQREDIFLNGISILGNEYAGSFVWGKYCVYIAV